MLGEKEFKPFVNTEPYQGLRDKDYLICSHTPDGKFFRVSDSSSRLVGYSPEELVGRNQYDFFHPEDKEFIRKKAYEIALSEGFSDSIVYRFKHKNGKYVLLETLTSVLRSEKGSAKIITTMTWLH